MLEDVTSDVFFVQIYVVELNSLMHIQQCNVLLEVYRQGRTGHLTYRANARWAVQYWGCLGPLGALKMHQNTLKCPLEP